MNSFFCNHNPVSGERMDLKKMLAENEINTSGSDEDE